MLHFAKARERKAKGQKPRISQQTMKGRFAMNRTITDLLDDLGMKGALRSLERQLKQDEQYRDMSFADRMLILLEDERLERENSATGRRLKKAKLRQMSSLEQVDIEPNRGIDRALLNTLMDHQWISRHENIVIMGATGVGKSFLACALGQHACRKGYSTSYLRVNKLFSELALVRGTSRAKKFFEALRKVNVLVLDDWGLGRLAPEESCDLLEIIESRHDEASTIIASQVPFENWFELIANPTIADAILDRLMHKSLKIRLTGSSKRAKIRTETTKEKEEYSDNKTAT